MTSAISASSAVKHGWTIAGGMTLLSLVIGVVGCVGQQAASEEGTPATDVVLAGEPADLATAVSQAVQGRTGPGGRPFEVQLRTPMLRQFPCSSCHEGPVVKAVRAEDAHQNVQPVHPTATGAACTNCHVASDVARLVLGSGETATLDQAYRLCAQCHFSQADAWAGGGHGKRVVAWQGRRVVMNCTGCHDPHRPAFEKRIPLRGPTIPGSGARQP